MPAPVQTPPVERVALSPAEAAQALGISRRTLSSLLADGSIASVKVGRRRLIAVAEVARIATEGAA